MLGISQHAWPSLTRGQLHHPQVVTKTRPKTSPANAHVLRGTTAPSWEPLLSSSCTALHLTPCANPLSMPSSCIRVPETWAYQCTSTQLGSPCEHLRVCCVPQLLEGRDQGPDMWAPPPRSVSRRLTEIPVASAKASLPASSSVEAEHRHAAPTHSPASFCNDSSQLWAISSWAPKGLAGFQIGTSTLWLPRS